MGHNSSTTGEQALCIPQSSYLQAVYSVGENAKASVHDAGDVAAVAMPDSAVCFCCCCHYRECALLLADWAVAPSCLLHLLGSLLVAVAPGCHSLRPTAMVLSLECMAVIIIAAAFSDSIMDVHYMTDCLVNAGWVLTAS